MAVVEYNRQKALAEYKQELTEWHEKQKIEMAKSRLEDVSTKAERYKVHLYIYATYCTADGSASVGCTQL
jgi:dsRNA-specific ribonuclease